MMDSANRPRYRASQLANVLTSQGRKQRWLADQIGVHESFISRVLSGSRLVDAEIATRISDRLGVPLFLLFELPEGNKTMPKGKEVAA